MSEAEARRDALVERLFGAAIGAMDLYGVYLGDRLGLRIHGVRPRLHAAGPPRHRRLERVQLRRRERERARRKRHEGEAGRGGEGERCCDRGGVLVMTGTPRKRIATGCQMSEAALAADRKSFIGP